MSPEIALHRAVSNRLVNNPDVVSLVPADNIIDRNQRPILDPSIVVGEGQSVDEGDSISRSLTRIYMDMHIWKKEPSLAGVRTIAGAIRTALSLRLEGNAGFHIADCYVSQMRFLRDPDGETSHGIVTISAKVQEL